jgi:hypothetical protein
MRSRAREIVGSDSAAAWLLLTKLVAVIDMTAAEAAKSGAAANAATGSGRRRKAGTRGGYVRSEQHATRI